MPSRKLRHHRQREIVAIAAFVGLEVSTADRDDCSVGQVAESAADWIGARIADYGNCQSGCQGSLGLSLDLDLGTIVSPAREVQAAGQSATAKYWSWEAAVTAG